MKPNINFSWHKSIKEIPKESWENLVGENIIPFYKLEWLIYLEKSESISNKYGWQPLHLTLWENNHLIALAPLYLKNHSYGEFIFDQPFVQLSIDLGLNYYPKLLGMSPLSPVEGYKFFIDKNKDAQEITSMMMNIIDEFAIKNKILSCNFLYVDPIWAKHGEKAGFSIWKNKQSQWSSNNDKNFDDYLARFNANQRRNIKRERKSITKANINISVINGRDIDLEMINMMHDFYAHHCSKWGTWGSKYLTREFFAQIIDKDLRNNIILFNANQGDKNNPLAMSMCITDWHMLWGRYWGAKEQVQNLHFELCYYSPISWAIENKIKFFDPGAGGNHKLRRGFEAKPRLSLHNWYDKRMSAIINAWLPKVNDMMGEEIVASNNEVPFKQKKIEL